MGVCDTIGLDAQFFPWPGVQPSSAKYAAKCNTMLSRRIRSVTTRTTRRRNRLRSRGSRRRRRAVAALPHGFAITHGGNGERKNAPRDHSNGTRQQRNATAAAGELILATRDECKRRNLSFNWGKSPPGEISIFRLEVVAVVSVPNLCTDFFPIEDHRVTALVLEQEKEHPNDVSF